MNLDPAPWAARIRACNEEIAAIKAEYIALLDGQPLASGGPDTPERVEAKAFCLHLERLDYPDQATAIHARDAAVRKAALLEAAEIEAQRFVQYLEAADRFPDATAGHPSYPDYVLAMKAAGEIEGVVRRLRAMASPTQNTHPTPPLHSAGGNRVDDNDR